MHPNVSGLGCGRGFRVRGVAAELAAAEAVIAEKAAEDPALGQYNLSGRVGEG